MAGCIEGGWWVVGRGVGWCLVMVYRWWVMGDLSGGCIVMGVDGL